LVVIVQIRPKRRHRDGAAFEPEGRFHTGEVATIDKYGYIEGVDRVKNFISRVTSGYLRSRWRS